jgi:hypothetical protein
MRNRGHRAGLLLATSAMACANAARASETVTYNYDSLGRLVRVGHSGTVNNGITAGYSYDPADNRTNVTVGGVPTVVGGGFEFPDVGAGYAYRPAGSPAAFSGNSGIIGNGSIWGFAAAPEGDQIAFIQSFGTAAMVSLSVNGLTPGASYTARFRIAARPGYGANPVTLAYEGVALGTFTPGSTAFAAVTSAAFTASAASGTLTFTGNGSAADLDTALDLVTVAAAGSN